MYKLLLLGFLLCWLAQTLQAATPSETDSETAEVLEQLEIEFQEQRLLEAEEALRQAQAYEQGDGGQDDATAVRFYKEAAELGNDQAQLRLGILYRQRKGVQEEFRNKSRFSLGKTAFDFLFSSKMDQESFRWLDAAAEQGSAEAQYYLAQFHEQGIGVTKDLKQANTLYTQAKEAGFDSAKALDLLKIEYDGIPSMVSEPEVEIADLAPGEAAEIEIISTTPDKTEIVSGNFTVAISAFSPLLSIQINGDNQELEDNSYDAAYSLPYELEIGENYFDLDVVTEATQASKELIIFRETEEIKKPKPKPPFQLITILGHTEDTNATSAADGKEKIRTHKSNIVLVPSYTHYINYRNSVAAKGLITTDRQWMEDQRNKEILLRQLSFEWERMYTWLGDITTGFGTNSLGLRDVPETNPTRDSWNSDFRQVSADSFFFGQFKLETDNKIIWQGKLEHRWKDAIGSTTDDGVADKLEVSNKFKLADWKYGTKFSYTLTDLNNDTKDKVDLKFSADVTIPVKPVSIKLKYDISEGEKQLTSNNGVREKDRKNVTTFGVTYPYAPWMIINISRKLETKTSNLTDKDYWKYQTTLQFTFIYK
jgi:TPR repeat protein